MTQALAVLLAGTWDDADEVGHVLIDHDRRFRRRYLLRTEQNRDILLDLPQAVRLTQDDGLLLQDGGIIRVCARPEALTEITAANPALLMRIVWHLGNRHLPVQFIGDTLRIRADHVMTDMIHQLGGLTQDVQAPFDPEAGAYAGGHHHHHDADDPDHRHD